MNGGGGEESDLAENIVGVDAYAAPAPTKKEFHAWHRPRKQFVREEQWCVQIEKLIGDSPPLAASGTLKYCGLPGADLIDLRCFHNAICKPKGIKLKFLGFNSAAAPKSPEQIELNISLDEVKKLDDVDPDSDVMPDDFRAVGNADSIAYVKMEAFGPFDVINLDLCDSFGADEAGLPNENYYDAIARLMAVQARQKTPWLLLLTTRVGKGYVHANTLDKFKDRYAKNLKDCKPFRELSLSEFGIGDEGALVAAIATATGHHHVFVTGICKWLMGLALAQHSSIEVKSALAYRVQQNAEVTDLVSLALRFTPHIVPANDPLKLANVSAPLPDECSLAARAIHRLAKLVDVDRIMAENGAIRTTMTHNMAKLLEAARYDVGAYTAWVEAQV